MIGIYKIENLLNGKVYIGQSVNIEKRWQDHKNRAKSHTASYTITNAMNKYGIDNFSFEVIEQCPIEELDSKEQYWIAYYDSYKNGYNETIGGGGKKVDDRAVYQYDIYGNYIKQYKNIYEAHEAVGGSLITLRDALKGQQKTAQGYIWLYEKRDFIDDDTILNGVICFSLETGERLAIFPSINKAAIETGDTPESIKSSCNNPEKNSGNYIWRYYNSDNKNILKVSTITTHGSFKMIDQYDLQGNFLKTFLSIAEITNQLGIDRLTIYNCCNGKTKKSHGFQWRYHGDTPPSPIKKNHKTKYTSILQLDLQNNVINEFKTIKDAAIFINKTANDAGHITECCKGRRNSYKGYCWRYKF